MAQSKTFWPSSNVTLPARKLRRRRSGRRSTCGSNSRDGYDDIGSLSQAVHIRLLSVGHPAESVPHGMSQDQSLCTVNCERRGTPSALHRIILNNRLAPPEESLDVRKLQLDIGWTAVIALSGVWRCFHFAQQRIHLLSIQPSARAHGGVARQRAG